MNVVCTAPKRCTQSQPIYYCCSRFLVPANKLEEYLTIGSEMLSSAYLFLCWLFRYRNRGALWVMAENARLKGTIHFSLIHRLEFTNIRRQTIWCSLNQSNGLVSQLWRIRKYRDVSHPKRHRLVFKGLYHSSALCPFCIQSRKTRLRSWEFLSWKALSISKREHKKRVDHDYIPLA